jgi:hypothetical protein
VRPVKRMPVRRFNLLRATWKLARRELSWTTSR